MRDNCLPSAILSMMKLRDLSAPAGTRYDSDCSTSRTNNLEFLSGVRIRNVKDEEMLKCSPNLRKLKCWYSYSFPSIDLCFLSHIESLNLMLVGLHKNMKSISFPSNIKKLTLSGRLKLPWEKMSVLGRLEKLEVLKLGNKVFVGERWDMLEGEFQKLKFFKLDGLYFKEWNADCSGHLPVLQRLVLKDCNRLHEIPSEIGEISSLQLIEIKGMCAESLVESAQLIRQQQCDIGNEELRLLINVYY
ncbi:hypothetical protein ACS0TY_000719 [Phlomoides rotata]